MMSCTIKPASDTALREVAERLKRGEVVGVPTETVYGLLADAANPQAIRKLKEIKGRDGNKPLQVMVPTKAWLSEIAVLSNAARKLVKAHMPGPLTLVLFRKPSRFIHDEVAPGEDTVGIRIPDHEVMLEILKLFGKPVVASSANPAGGKSPVTAAEVKKSLGAKLTLVIDGGKSQLGKGSTVAGFTSDELKIFREGSLSAAQLRRTLKAR